MHSIGIIGNGTYHDHSERLSHYDTIIAADGGSDHCIAMNIEPDHVVGDFDSLSEEARSSFSEKLKEYPDQNSTDMMKTLQFISETFTQPYRIDAFCVIGEKRPDHSLAALALLQQHVQLQQIFTSQHSIQYTSATTELSHHEGRTLSLIPVSDTATVVLTGCKWSGEFTLDHTSVSGISNSITESEASVEVKNGAAYLVIGT